MNKKWERPTSLDVKRAFIYSWFSLKKSATVNLNTAFLYGKGGRRMWRGHLPEGSVIVHGCFCFGNILKIYAFYPNFPLVGFVIGGFYWLFLWNFKEIKHQPFSMAQPLTKSHRNPKMKISIRLFFYSKNDVSFDIWLKRNIYGFYKYADIGNGEASLTEIHWKWFICLVCNTQR